MVQSMGSTSDLRHGPDEQPAEVVNDVVGVISRCHWTPLPDLEMSGEHQDQRRGPPSRCPDLVRCILLFYGAFVHCRSLSRPNDHACFLERPSVLQGCRAGASAEGVEQQVCKGHDARVPNATTVELMLLQRCS